MNQLIEYISHKPWLLIVAGFFILVSVWVIFFILAVQNQPEKVGF